MKKFLIFLVFLSAVAPSDAQASRSVTSPYIEKDTLKLKWKPGVTHDDERPSRDGAVTNKLAAEYGVAEILSLEGEGNVENAGHDDNTNMTGVSLKAKIQLAEKGKYWIDPAARLSYEIDTTDDADSFELKLIAAKDLEKFRHVANFVLDREIGEKSEDEVNGGFSWSSRYKWKKQFEPGFEVYSNFGALSGGAGFNDQDHSIGPVVYGKLGEHIKYETGYLVGISENAADGRWKAAVEYGIKF